MEDVIAYNIKYTEKEGGRPGAHPAWPKGQDNFEKSLESKGVMDDTYYKALAYIWRKSREEGIDAALSCGGLQLDGLLVPVQAETGVACQVAAKAGESCMGCLFGYINPRRLTLGINRVSNDHSSCWRRRPG